LQSASEDDNIDFQLKNNYGFVGEMICGMAADTGSGVRILVIAFLVCFALLFRYGPPALIPFLSEFLCGILPLQSTLRGVLTAANDMNRHPGEPYTEGQSLTYQNASVKVLTNSPHVQVMFDSGCCTGLYIRALGKIRQSVCRSE
jgi:hypothetical protein